MANLNFTNMDGEYLIFIRMKTERRTRNDQKPIKVYLNECVHRIIKAWAIRTGYWAFISSPSCSRE